MEENISRSGLGQRVFGDVALGVVGGVAVDDAGLYGPVHRRSVSNTNGFGGSRVTSGNSQLEFFVQRLETGFDRAVARSKTQGFAGGFDSRFGVGHGGGYVLSRSKTQTHGGESSVFCRRRPVFLALSGIFCHPAHAKHPIDLSPSPAVF
jgi:hypothetical protein